MSPRKVYICFGGNLGDTISTFQRARKLLSESIGEICGISKLYKTTPLTKDGVDPHTIPSYLNAAVCFFSRLPQLQILDACLEIERKLGRIRDPDNQLASRTIDLDIALIEDEILEKDILTIPHPRLHERDFMLQPIIDISAEVIHPKIGERCSALLAKLDSSFVESCINESW